MSGKVFDKKMCQLYPIARQWCKIRTTDSGHHKGTLYLAAPCLLTTLQVSYPIRDKNNRKRERGI